MPLIRLVDKKDPNKEELFGEAYRNVAATICGNQASLDAFEGMNPNDRADHIRDLADAAGGLARIKHASNAFDDLDRTNTNMHARKDDIQGNGQRNVRVPLPPEEVEDWGYLEDYIQAILAKLQTDQALVYDNGSVVTTPVKVDDANAKETYQMLLGMMMLTRCR